MEILFFPAIIAGLYLWFRSYWALFNVRQFHTNRKHRTLLAALPVFCVAVFALVVRFWSSPDVRSDVESMVLYTLGGAAWLQLGLFLLALLGVGVREDVIERQNPAAAWVVSGAMIGTTFCYAGSNIGSGPGAEVVLFCAVLSTAFLFASWFFLERVFRLADQITIDRNEGAGIRVGGWMCALGLIFGAAVAGDWVSLQGTIWDFFRYAWVALPFFLAAIAIEAAFRSLQARTEPRRGAWVAAAFAYFLAAAVYVAWRGVH
ncbi:MAG TPA: hypothetical protein VEI73_10590 [Candidatus Acidoferrum sp.]|nr:hypothetical protein [Candidatus Acidoferrum sp.]